MKKKKNILIITVVAIVAGVVFLKSLYSMKQVKSEKGKQLLSKEAVLPAVAVKKTSTSPVGVNNLKNNSQNQKAVSGTMSSGQMRKTIKSAMVAAKKIEKGETISARLRDEQKKAYKLIPEKLLKPADEIKYAKNNGQLNEYDRKVLSFINQVRAVNNLEMLKKMPTGLNEKECLALMNAMRVMRGDKPLDNMPTGLKVK